jgi:hypothetical protein
MPLDHLGRETYHEPLGDERQRSVEVAQADQAE